MKSLKSIVLSLMLVWVSALSSLGSTNPADDLKKESLSVSFKPLSENHKALISVKNLSQSKISLNILDAQGSIIYNKEITDAVNYIEKYNFSKLDYGKYTLEILNKDQVITQSFRITKDGNFLLENQTSMQVLAPLVDFSEGKLTVRMMNQISMQGTLMISSESGEVFYQEIIAGESAYGKILNLENLKKGSYLFSIAIGENEYTKKIEL
ncbi:hypothetical protein [Flexithrix dorotheae]|uniref:hypothetical protein n=1 Tax=Flexithrix dorotheae TaxID=70993 RepID=UPI000376C4B8|nr:hypothetical protein [Flexithrix dorotheae]